MDTNQLEYYKEAYEELKLILDMSFDQITIADGNGVFTRVSKSCESYFGVAEEELIGCSGSDMEKIGVFDTSVTAEVVRRNDKVTLIQKTGAGKILMVTGVPIYDDNNNRIKIINISKDITENTKVTQRLKDVEEELNWVKRELNKRKSKENHKTIYKSISMNKIMELIYHISDSDATVLILGETGVGKGYISKTIHTLSSRKEKPFININCSAIPEPLLESELFGYEGGAFSGANSKGKKGLFEMAGEGTIFLDEIGDMSLKLQAKLLHVLDSKMVYRVGGEKPIKIKARIMAATNKDLQEKIKKDEFREDLYYRLNVIPIEIPPLRERKEDIPHLIKNFIENNTKECGVEKSLSEEAYNVLINYEYPGNIRELENIIERLIITTPIQIIEKHHITDIIKPSKNFLFDFDELIPIKKAVAELEKKILIEAFRKYKTTRKVAEILEIDQSTVVKKAKKLKINIS